MLLNKLIQGSTLDRERYLVLWSICLLPGLTLSGLATWLVEHPGLALIQTLYLLHTALGIIVLPLAIAYLIAHFARTLGNRSVGVFFSGIAAAFLTGVSLASGAWLALFGQTETTRWVLEAHIVSSIVLITVALVHLLLFVQARRQKKRSSGNWPSLEALRYRAPLIALAVQLALIPGVWLTSMPSTGTGYLPIPSKYSKAYGDNPLRPSEAQIEGGDLVREEVVGGSEECGSCHKEIFKQWSSSMHRKAAMDPAYTHIVTLLVDKKGIEATRYCDGCHGPMTLLSGQLTPGGKHSGIAGTPANHEGVSCVSCHSIAKPVHTKGVASYDFMPRKPYLFEYSDNPIANFINHRLIRMRPELHRMNFDASRVSTPEVCASCHAQFMDKNLNDWGWIKMQDEYSGWLNSPYSGRSNTGFTTAQVTTCVDCHMTVGTAHDPSSSSEGLVHGHNFAAANTFVPSVTGDEPQENAVRRFLATNKMRVTVDIADNPAISQSDSYLEENLRNKAVLPRYYYLGQTVKANILVANTGVGHEFPGGTIDINEAWVAIQVTDATGKTIYRSGDISQKGEVDPDAWFYRSVAVDRHGKLLWRHDLFNMIGEHYRNTIPAGKSDNIPLEFKIPQWAVSPLTVSAQLNYRKLTQRYLSWLMPDSDITLPVVVMAQDAETLPVLTVPPTANEF